jgi:hypothetical protein
MYKLYTRFNNQIVFIVLDAGAKILTLPKQVLIKVREFDIEQPKSFPAAEKLLSSLPVNHNFNSAKMDPFNMT